jgi:hypothetical protein
MTVAGGDEQITIFARQRQSDCPLSARSGHSAIHSITSSASGTLNLGKHPLFCAWWNAD